MPEVTRVLHIHVGGLGTLSGVDETVLDISFKVGLSTGSTISDSIVPELGLKVSGVYKTPIQMNQAIETAVKEFLSGSPNNIPTDGYLATYVSGSYGLLSVL